MTKLIRIVFIICIFIFSTNACLCLPTLNIEEMNYSYENENEIIKYINITYNSDTQWQLSVTCYEDNIKNTTHYSKDLSFDVLQIKNETSLDCFYANRNFVQVIEAGSFSANNTHRYLLRVNKKQGFYTGDYVARLKFSLSTQDAQIIVPYDFRFNIAAKTNIYSVANNINIDIKNEDLLKINNTFKTAIPSVISVVSNTDWELYARTKHSLCLQEYREPLRYSADTAEGNFVTINNYETRVLSDTYSLIASGQPDISNDYQIRPQEVKINYFYMPIRNQIQSSCDYKFEIEYYIKSKDNKYNPAN